jgi:hypothetical protein
MSHPSDPSRRQSPQTPRPLAQFAIVGVDRRGSKPISTVIEAVDEAQARLLAERQGIILSDLKPMHPLAGAAAVKLARDDPHDRFNRHHAEEWGKPQAEEDEVWQDQGPPIPDNAGRPYTHGSYLPGTSSQSQGQAVHTISPLGFLVILLGLGALVYFVALRDAGPGAMLSFFNPQAASAEVVSNPSTVLQPDERVRPEAAVVEYFPPAGEKLILQATAPATRNTTGSAVISGQVISRGHRIAGYRLAQVNQGWVVLQKQNELIALRIAKQAPR